MDRWDAVSIDEDDQARIHNNSKTRLGEILSHVYRPGGSTRDAKGVATWVEEGRLGRYPSDRGTSGWADGIADS
ncbi:hypothetical protein FRB94_008081 [Tulasnella sp. JGI-2019a]|nr:hypothetical protein FRB94_008081 [Tulasnella sp. JGI-2019a]